MLFGAMKYEYKPHSKTIMKFGEVGSKYYIIINGDVSTLLINICIYRCLSGFQPTSNVSSHSESYANMYVMKMTGSKTLILFNPY